MTNKFTIVILKNSNNSIDALGQQPFSEPTFSDYLNDSSNLTCQDASFTTNIRWFIPPMSFSIDASVSFSGLPASFLENESPLSHQSLLQIRGVFSNRKLQLSHVFLPDGFRGSYLLRFQSLLLFLFEVLYVTVVQVFWRTLGPDSFIYEMIWISVISCIC